MQDECVCEILETRHFKVIGSCLQKSGRHSCGSNRHLIHRDVQNICRFLLYILYDRLYNPLETAAKHGYSLQSLRHHFRNIYVLFLHFKLHAYIFLLRPNQKRASEVIISVWPKLCFVTVCHLWWSLSLSFVALCLPLFAHTLCKYHVEATEQSYLQLDRQ